MAIESHPLMKIHTSMETAIRLKVMEIRPHSIRLPTQITMGFQTLCLIRKQSS